MTQQGDNPWGPSDHPQQGYHQDYPPGQEPRSDPWAASQRPGPPSAPPWGYRGPGPQDRQHNARAAVPPQFQTDRPDAQRYRPPQSRQQPQFQPYQQPQYRPPGPGFTPPPQYQAPQWQQPYGPQQRQPRVSRKGLAFLGCGGLGALVVLIAVVAASTSSPSSSTPPASSATQTQAAVPPVQSAAASKAPAAQTVTYEVTGSAADVTYGPAGSDYAGSVPMHVTKPLGTPIYYAISAQLQGGGTVSCKILVNGTVVSQATASGGYNIADCEISQDPLSGQWEDTNS